MPMTTHHFTLTEYDPAKPWMIIKTERTSIELPEGDSFQVWAREQYPNRDRWKVELQHDHSWPGA